MPMRSMLDWPITGVALLANGPLARLFWGVFDDLDYRLTQAKLWTVDMVWGPEPETAADRQRQRDPGEFN
jgi:hypothetical protein